MCVASDDDLSLVKPEGRLESVDDAGLLQPPVGVEHEAPRRYHRLAVAKAMDRTKPVRLLVPFYAMDRHDHLRPDSGGERTQIGRGGVAARVDMGDLSS